MLTLIPLSSMRLWPPWSSFFPWTCRIYYCLFSFAQFFFAWNVLSLAPSWHWGLQLRCHLLKEAFWLPCSSSLLPRNRPSPEQWLKTVIIIYLAQISEGMGAERGISLGLSCGCCPIGISKSSSSYTWCLGWEVSESWELAQLTAQAFFSFSVWFLWVVSLRGGLMVTWFHIFSWRLVEWGFQEKPAEAAWCITLLHLILPGSLKATSMQGDGT